MDLSSAPLLSIVMFLPLVGAVIIGFLNREAKDNARWVALWTTIVTFLVSLIIWVKFDTTTARLPVRREPRLARRHASSSSASTASRCCS